MSLILQSNPKRGKIRIQFDAEGRRILLADIEGALRGEGHASGVLGVQLDEPADTGADWQAVEFYNIVCVAEEKAPLRVDESVSISGGRKALCTLRNKLQNLPEKRLGIELNITDAYPAPRKRGLRPWLAGVACCAPFLYLAGNSLSIFTNKGDDMAGLQFWCYLAAALALLPMPWLISLRSGLSVRLNAGFGMAALVPMLFLLLGVFKDTAVYINLPEPLFNAFLLAAAVLTTAAATVPYVLWCKNPTEAKEKRIMKWLDKLVLRFLCALVLFALLSLASLLCYSGPEHWYDYPFILPMLASFVLPVGLLAGFLRPGFWQRACYRLLTFTLLPGLIMAVPCYFLGTPVIGIDDVWSRLFICLLPLVPALCLFPYLRRKIRK